MVFSSWNHKHRKSVKCWTLLNVPLSYVLYRVMNIAPNITQLFLGTTIKRNIFVQKRAVQNNPQSAQGLKTVTNARCIWINHCHLPLWINNTSILGQNDASSLPCQQRKRGNQMESCFCGQCNNSSISNGPGWGNVTETGPRTSLTPNCFLSFCVWSSGTETFGQPLKMNLYFCIYVCTHCTVRVSLCVCFGC